MFLPNSLAVSAPLLTTAGFENAGSSVELPLMPSAIDTKDSSFAGQFGPAPLHTGGFQNFGVGLGGDSFGSHGNSHGDLGEASEL